MCSNGWMETKEACVQTFNTILCSRSCYYLFILLAEKSGWERKRTRQNCLLMFTFVSSARTPIRANGQAWCCKAAWERARDWMFKCFTVESSDESCMICILHACCVGFSLLICTCVSFLKCNNFHSYSDMFCFHYHLTLLISKASFFCSRQSYSYLRTVRLDSLWLLLPTT